MTTELPRGTVTFLFTDIEGSTALLEALGSEQYHDVLVEHQRLLRSAFEEEGGREVDTQGDAFFVAFQKARDAVMQGQGEPDQLPGGVRAAHRRRPSRR